MRLFSPFSSRCSRAASSSSFSSITAVFRPQLEWRGHRRSLHSTQVAPRESPTASRYSCAGLKDSNRGTDPKCAQEPLLQAVQLLDSVLHWPLGRTCSLEIPEEPPVSHNVPCDTQETLSCARKKLSVRQPVADGEVLAAASQNGDVWPRPNYAVLSPLAHINVPSRPRIGAGRSGESYVLKDPCNPPLAA